MPSRGGKCGRFSCIHISGRTKGYVEESDDNSGLDLGGFGYHFGCLSDRGLGCLFGKSDALGDLLMRIGFLLVALGAFLFVIGYMVHEGLKR